MVLLLLAANILCSFPMAALIFLLIVLTGSGTSAATKMYADKLDVNWIIDLFNHQMPGFSLESIGVQVVALFVVIGLSYLLLNTLFAGGIIEIFACEDSRFTMRKFFSGCGIYFWRFFRLMLISLVFYGAATVIYALIRVGIDRYAAQSTAYEPLFYKRWAALLLLFMLLAFINMVFDYAKISTVVNESSKMFQEAIKALRFSLHFFFTAFGLYLLIGVIGIALFILLVLLRGSINQSSTVALLLAILLGQLTIAARIWTRLTYYAAELDLYQRLNPKPLPIIVPVLETEPMLAIILRQLVINQPPNPAMVLVLQFDWQSLLREVLIANGTRETLNRRRPN